MLSAVAQAALEGREVGGLRSVVQILAADPKDGPAGSRAGTARARVYGRRLVSFPGMHAMQRNLP
jgi:hypothetical protein